MSELKKCRACGVDLRPNALFGHCPKCQLELGFATAPGDSVESAADSALRTPHSESEKVRYFGDYELLEQLGRGGMGIVLKALQQSLNRIVALKMISAGEFASPSAVQRFQIEAEAAAKLDHPNIVPIYEIGMHRGQHYFSTGFIEGRDLAKEIRDGKFRVVAGEKSSSKSAARQQQLAVARLMVTVARSVHYAHQRGVLHRDLKPSNSLLDSDGQPHLTDCGLAKILEHEAGVTRTAEVMGTPSYMSPEQAAGRELSTATDVYSLGAILYELLTGRPPFLGPSAMEVLQQLAAQVLLQPQLLNPRVDPDLATACLKCLEKDPLRHYDSASALADDLEHWVAGRPILARPVSLGEKFWRWCRREPALACLGATVVIVILLGLVGTSWQAVRAKRAERRLGRLRTDAELALSASDFLQGVRFISEGNEDDAVPFLARSLSANPTNAVASTRLTTLLTYHSWMLPTLTLKHGSEVNSAHFRPDGKRIVTASADNTARVWDVAPTQPKCPDWLLQLGEAISGQTLNKQGLLEPTRLNRVETLNQLRQKLNQEPGDDDWVVWGRWFLADRATRTISPFSKITVPQYFARTGSKRRPRHPWMKPNSWPWEMLKCGKGFPRRAEPLTQRTRPRRSQSNEGSRS